MMDFGQFAVSQGFRRWDRRIRASVNRQFEGNSVVRARAAKRPDDQPRIDRLGDGEKLYGKVLLSLRQDKSAGDC